MVEDIAWDSKDETSTDGKKILGIGNTKFDLPKGSIHAV
jgi:hypothetical protein